jgi:small-conductance mechanosensitive channel
MSWEARAFAWVHEYLGISPALSKQLLWTLAVALAAVLLRRLIVWIIVRRTPTPASRYLGIKALDSVVGLAVLMALLRIWLGGIEGLAASIGIISAGLAIALNQPLTNLAGWIFLAIRRPFTIGDRIQIGEHAGDVVDLRLFAFSLNEIGRWVNADQSTGRILHIPNGVVFRETVANYTRGFNFIWNELAVTITFESDWRHAQRILTEIIEQHSAIHSEEAAREVRRAASKYLIRYEHLTPIVWTSVDASGVTLTMRYLCNPRGRRSSEHAIWEAILDAFAATPDIDFAYPTTRFYDNRTEGKPGKAAT